MRKILLVFLVLVLPISFDGLTVNRVKTATQMRATSDVWINLAPFVCQAPFAYLPVADRPKIQEGDKQVDDLAWSDDRQANACEEACLTMAALYLKGYKSAPELGVKDVELLTKAREMIFKLCQFQVDSYKDHVEWLDKVNLTTIWKGYYQDSSVARTCEIWKDSGIIEGAKYEILNRPTYEEIKRELDGGSVIAVPINGTLGLESKYYNLKYVIDRHMVLVIGYSEFSDKTMEGKKFLIAHDPGTRNGERYYFPADDFIKCIQDYPSGSKAPRELPQHFQKKAIVLCKE